MKLIWILALKNLQRYWKKHALTALGLIFGFVGVLLLGGYMLRMNSYLSTQTIFLRTVGHISIWHKNGPHDYYKDPTSYLINLGEAQKIVEHLKESGIEIVRTIPILKGTGMLTNGCEHFPVLITGIPPEDQQWVYSHPQVSEWIPELAKFNSGSGLWSNPDSKSQPAMVAPVLFNMLRNSSVVNCINTLADKSPFLQVYTQPISGGIGISDVALTGEISTGFVLGDESSLTTSLDVMQRILNTDDVTHLSVFLKNPGQISNALKIAREFNSDFEIESYDNNDVSEIYVGSMNFVYVMLSFFAVLVCGVVILTVLNSFQIAFMERRSEIATLKAVGFKIEDIQKIFLAEYFILNSLSLVIGGVIGLIVCAFIKNENFRFHIPGYANDLQFMLTPSVGYASVVILCFYILVLLTCFLLCRRSANVEIVELLRSDT